MDFFASFFVLQGILKFPNVLLTGESFMSEIVIRNVKFEDLRRVSEIVVESWKTAYRGIVADEYLESLTVDQNYQKRLNDYTDGGFVVAEINNEVVGFCRYRFENAYEDKFPDVDCELCALYVKSAYKGNGVGKKIINYVMNDFKEKGYKKMILWCFKDNYPARMFYEKMGGIYGSEGIITRGEKDYKEVSYTYDLKNQMLFMLNQKLMIMKWQKKKQVI